MHLHSGLCLEPRWGELTALPRPPGWWGKACFPSARIRRPLSIFSSNFGPSGLRSAPQDKIFGYATVVVRRRQEDVSPVVHFPSTGLLQRAFAWHLWRSDSTAAVGNHVISGARMKTQLSMHNATSSLIFQTSAARSRRMHCNVASRMQQTTGLMLLLLLLLHPVTPELPPGVCRYERYLYRTLIAAC